MARQAMEEYGLSLKEVEGPDGTSIIQPRTVAGIFIKKLKSPAIPQHIRKYIFGKKKN
jgi:hypothetical protein